VFEDLKGSVAPGLVIVPRRDDAHQDHRLLAQLTWSTFRDHLVLKYEIPDYEGDLGGELEPVRAAAGRDLRAEGGAAAGAVPQSARPLLVHPRYRLGVAAPARRGMQRPSGFAEAFHTRRRP
jgi:LmbE family N-acetylglucosaminyl deacetylase